MKHILNLPLISLLSTLCVTGAAHADACQTIIHAYKAMAKVEAYQQTLALTNQPPLEMRVVGQTMYMNEGTGWTKLPTAPDMRERVMKQLLPDASALQNCKEAPGETINGVSTTAYDYFLPEVEKMMAGTGQQRVFIGGDGLPYAMRSKGTEVTLQYDGVKAP